MDIREAARQSLLLSHTAPRTLKTMSKAGPGQTWNPSTGDAEAGRLPVLDYMVSENQKGKEENELSHAL